MLLHESRRARARRLTASWCCSTIRTARAGTGEQIAEGAALVERALAVAAASGRTRCRRRSPPSTPRRRTPAATDWAQIVGLYDVLLRADPSPVVELNRAAAVAMRDGPPPGSR